jgi:hypothetical protein
VDNMYQESTTVLLHEPERNSPIEIHLRTAEWTCTKTLYQYTYIALISDLGTFQMCIQLQFFDKLHVKCCQAVCSCIIALQASSLFCTIRRIIHEAF